MDSKPTTRHEPEIVPIRRAGRRPFWQPFALMVGAFVLGGLILPNLHVSWREPEGAAQARSGLNVLPGPAPTQLAEAEVYARAAQSAYKSVVNIDTTQRVRVAPDFFDDWMSSSPRFRTASSEGSGVIIDKSGYILTNEHVVGAVGEAGKNILVTLTDGRKMQGTVVGADRTTDVALVKVAGNDLPAAQIGTKNGLVPGQMCVAIGNPLGFRFTVTHGVISALGRPISNPDGRVYPDLIQHDAGINPGNSGGALVNLQGQVIGINTLVDSRAQGIGFAIPIDTALRVADELKKFGRIKRPWLGVIVQTNTPQVAARFDLSDVRGAVVYTLYGEGQAANAGLQPGDVITRVNGQKVQSDEDYKNVEKTLRIGDTVPVEIHRAEQFATVSVRVGEAP